MQKLPRFKVKYPPCKYSPVLNSLSHKQEVLIWTVNCRSALDRVIYYYRIPCFLPRIEFDKVYFAGKRNLNDLRKGCVFFNVCRIQSGKILKLLFLPVYNKRLSSPSRSSAPYAIISVCCIAACCKEPVTDNFRGFATQIASRWRVTLIASPVCINSRTIFDTGEKCK